MSFRSSLTPLVVLAAMLGGCDRSDKVEAQETTSSARATDTSPKIDPATEGTPLPAITLTDPDGNTLDTGVLVGEPVLVNLWATWCAPCVKEMPLLENLAQDYHGKLKVVTVSEDMGDGAKVRAFFKAQGFTHLTQWLDGDGALMSGLEAGSLPLTVLFDAKGREVWRVNGDFDWSGEEARAAIDSAIAP